MVAVRLRLSRLPCRAFCFFLLFLLPACLARADEVKSIRSDGTMMLSSGKIVRLAGVQVSREGIAVLSALISGKAVEVEPEREGEPALFGPEEMYLFVQASTLELPYKPSAMSRKSRVMVNELLIQEGAGSVAKDKDFRYKADFLAMESAAKARGAGIWSYELASLPETATKQSKQADANV